MRIALRRTRAHAALFASIVGVVLVACAFGVGITGYLGVSALDGTRASFSTATGSDGAIRVEADLGDSPTKQDVAARGFIERSTTAPLDIDRSLFSSGVDSSAGPLDLASFEGLPSRADLVTGSWPTNPTQASIEAAAAASAHLSVGDSVTIGSTTLTVSAIWKQSRPLDPRWFGSVLSADGSDSAAEGDIGPLVIDPSVWSSIDSTPTVRWTIVPRASSVQPADLPSLESLGSLLTTRLPDVAAVTESGVVVSGDLGTTAAAARSALSAVGGVSPVPLLLIVVVSFVTLFELSRLLVSVRAGETALLRSRGASAALIARDSAIEAVIVAVPAAAVGGIVGALVVVATAGGWPTAASVVLFPVASVLVVVALATFAAWTSARRALRRDSANDSGRARSVAAGGLVVVVVAVAAFAVWQFLLYGSPLVRQSTGELGTDPVAVLAAPLSLLALATVALALFPLVSRLLETLAARSLGLVRVLSARQLARRITVFATPVLVLTLATGGVVLAAGYSATWDSATTATRSLRTGADVRLEQPTDAPLATATAAELRGVTAAVPVLSADTTLGDDAVSLVASGAPSSDVGVALPVGAHRLGIELHLERSSVSQLDAAAWLQNSAGEVLRMPLPTLTSHSSPAGAPTPLVFIGTVPSGRWRLVAIDARLSGSSSGDTFTVQVAQATADSTDVPLDRWTVQSSLPIEGTVAPAPERSATGTIAGRAPVTLRFMPQVGAASAGAQPIPVQVSRSLATRADLGVGDPISLTFSDEGRDVSGTVAGVVPAVRGMTGDYGASTSLGDLELQQLRVATTVPDPDVLWLTTTSPSATVAALRKAIGASAIITTTGSDASTPVLASARVALWAGAIGALLLAVVTVSAVAGAMIRARAAEVVVLTAVGLTAREQARARRRELATVVVFGVVVGLAGGWAVARILVAGLTRSTVLDPIPGLAVPLLFAPVGLVACIAALAITVIGLIAVYGARVVRQVRSSSAREEVR